ncbi:MAG: hypothetical protein Q7Q71_14155, partial [Verrucomicrobiota bacterium JB023]|nr:hypothetical protein [Verrucomicrobiota bacterium JB023]
AFSQGSNWALGWTGTSDLGHFVNASDSILTNLTGDDVDVMASELVSFDSSLGVYVLNGSQTLDSTKNYILTDRLFVTDGNVLTIPAGTKIYNTTNDFGTADKADDEFGSIVITRGSQIVAEGTAAAPIEFTTIRELEAERGMDMDSDSVAGLMPTKADRGLWGGLVILGNARTYNYSAPGVLIGENVIEGFAPSVSPDADNDGRADIIEYGGTNDEESSGILTYVSIRHGGYEFETDNEINGLTLGGVGSGTTLEYIEVMSNSDDGIEFFGGTANLKYALVSFVKDDGFDLDEGYTGNIQFACVIQTPTDTDSDDNSIQDSDHGGEWDGNVGGDTNDFQTAPTIANITFIGDNEGDHAFKIDDFFAGSVYNGAVTSFADLVTVTGDAVLNDTASFTNVSTDVSNALEADNVSVESVLAAQFTDASSTGVGLNFVDVANALYDPRPAADSVLLAANGAAVTDLSADSFFEVTDYQGAFSQGSNWALGWTGTDALGHFLQPDGDVIITSISKDGNNATIEFMSEASATYQITYSDDLTSFADTISGETGIPGTGGVVSRTFLIPDGTPEKLFFRVEEE